METCSFCEETLPDRGKLIKHIRYLHHINLQYFCRYQCFGCKIFYDNYQSFQKHKCKTNVFKKFKVDNEYLNCDQDENMCTFEETLNSKVTLNSEETLTSEETLNSENTLNSEKPADNTFIKNFEEKLVKISINLLIKLNVNRSNITSNLSLVSDLINSTFDCFLNLLDCESQEYRKGKKMFDNCAKVLQSFQSEYKLFQYLKNYNLFIEPINLKIEDNNNTSYMAWVSLKDNLTSFLCRGDNLSQIIKEYDHIDKLDKSDLSSVIQSETWKSKIKPCHFEGNCLSFPIDLFYDDFEVGNPLGSHSGVHKLGAIYATIPLLPVQFSSQLENILLVALFHASDLKTFNHDLIFRDILAELKLLEEDGIVIHISNDVYKIRFFLGQIIGDNLGLNTILGFQDSFASNFYCRLCRSHKFVCQTETDPESFEFRTKSNYSRDLELKNPKETGIKKHCVFSSLESFSVTHNVTVDLMHDLFEGVCPIFITFTLKYCIKSKFFSLKKLNELISEFDFKACNENMPPLIKDFENSIKMSASEMLSFCRCLPLIIGSFIPSKNKHWHLILNLRKIVAITMKSIISIPLTYYLEKLITDTLGLYLKLSAKHLTPKMHILLHYPYVIRKIGPPIKYWCMRYESMHQLMKKCATTINSRANITFSIAMRYQLMLSEIIHENRGVRTKYLFSKKTVVEIASFFHNDCKNVNCILKTKITHIDSMSWLIQNNKRFSIKSIVQIGFDEVNNLPIFGRIRNIFTYQEEFYFLYEELQTFSFMTHLYVYKTKPMNDINCICLSNLLLNICDPFPCITKDDNEYVLISPRLYLQNDHV